MFTPMIGGAEKLLKDFLVSVDKERFIVSLFYESWPEFDTFLELNKCPEIQVYPLRIIEPGGHISTMGKLVQPEIDVPRRGSLYNLVVTTLNKTRSLYRKHFPFRKYFGAFLSFLPHCFFIIPNLFYLYRAFRKHPVDVLHIINGGYPGAMSAREAAIAAKLAGVSVCIMTIGTTPIKDQGIVKVLNRIIDKLVIKCVDKFIVPAEPVGQFLREFRKVEPLKLCTIPWGVPIPDRLLTDLAISNLREKLNVPKEARIIGNIARFEPRKGHSYLIEAILILKKRVSNFHVVLVGEGLTKQEIENQVEASGLKEIVTFAGYRSDTCELTQMFDIFVYPSMLEGLPISLLEAMSLGKPIVATPTDGIAEAIIDGKSGLLVPPCDSLLLAQALESLLVNPELAEDIGRASFARFEEKYTRKQMIQQNEILYKKLLAKKICAVL